jgi:hypothetical protein
MTAGRNSAKTVLWILWGSFLCSIVLYAAIALLATPSGPIPAPVPPVLLAAFGIESVAVSAAAVAIRSTRVTVPLCRGRIDLETPAGMRVVRTGLLVSWALAESVGIVGLVVALMARRLAPAAAFWVLSATLLLALAPRLPGSKKSQGG